MIGRLACALGVILAATLIAAGCGGAGQSETPSKQEFVAQANKICRKGQAQIKQQAKRTFSGGKPSRAEQRKFIADTVVPSIQNQSNQISHLTPPQGDEGRVEAIVAAAKRTVHRVKRNPALAEAGSGAKPYARFDRLARAYGLDTCGR